MHNPTLRVTEVLTLLCTSAVPLRLSEISKQLNMPKSTLLPILQTLVSCQYISKDEAERYFPGFALLGLGTAARTVYGPSDLIREQLKKLVERFRETCYYGILENGEVLYLEKMDSPQPLRMLTSIGRRLPAYATGIGKALLLDKTKQQLEELYSQGMKALTEHTVTDPDALHRQLQQAREMGYTWEKEESTEHIRCFAVPVRQKGEIIAAVSIAIPVFRYREEEKSAIVQALKETAQEIEKGMELLL